MVSLLATMLAGGIGLPAVPAVLALAVLVVNFPTGQAMRDPLSPSAGAALK